MRWHFSDGTVAHLGGKVATLGFVLLGCATVAPDDGAPEATGGIAATDDGSGGVSEANLPEATGGEVTTTGGAPSSGGTGGTVEAAGGTSTDELLSSCPGYTVYLNEVQECFLEICELWIGESYDDFVVWPCYVDSETATGACPAPDDTWGCCCHPVVYEGTGGSPGVGGSE